MTRKSVTHITGLRFREDTGLEWKCRACGEYWPLTEEFWRFRPSSFSRCRGCLLKQRRDLNRRRYGQRLATDPEFVAQRRAYKREYDAQSREARRVKNQAYYWSDPEAQRAKARERYYAKRDEILRRKRAAYWAEKAA